MIPHEAPHDETQRERTLREAVRARLARIKVAQAKRETDELVERLNVLEAVFLPVDDHESPLSEREK